MRNQGSSFLRKDLVLASFRRAEGELRRLGGFSSLTVVARFQQISRLAEHDLVPIKRLKLVKE